MFGFGKDKQGRQQQIKELKTAFPNLRSVKGDHEFELLFQSSGQLYVLKILLDTTHFPILPPIFQVPRPEGFNHLWVDRNKNVVGCPEIMSWSKTSSLAAVTQIIVKEFQNPTASRQSYAVIDSSHQMNDSFISNQNQNSSHGMTPLYHTNSQNSYSNPPAYEQVINGNRSISIGYSSMMGSPGGALPPLGPLPYGGTLTSYGAPISPPPAYGTLPATTSESSLTSLSSAGNNHSADSNLIPVRKRQVSDDFSSITMVPDIPARFPELREKSEYELEGYLEDPEAFQVLLRSTQSVESMTRLRDDLRKSNFNQATQTLQLENGLKLRQELCESQALLKRLTEEFRNEYDALVNEYAPNKGYVLAQLQQQRDDAEGVSESLSSRFLAGECDMQTFIHDYFEQRKNFHMTSSKYDLLLKS